MDEGEVEVKKNLFPFVVIAVSSLLIIGSAVFHLFLSFELTQFWVNAIAQLLPYA